MQKENHLMCSCWNKV